MDIKKNKIHPVKSRKAGISTKPKLFNRVKVLVAMSGGVDSSVAAALLVNAGYNVTGAFMVNYTEPRENRLAKSCWQGDYHDALRVAAKLGIKLLRLNFIKEYKEMVLNYMYKEYAAGRTPNPDILCNKFIKFGVWLKKIKELDFDKLATGHYARLGREIRNRIKLLQAKDNNKDQTYFLNQLTREQLKRVIFPVGQYTKAQVRILAKKFNLPTADKEESMGICFVGEVPIKNFLMDKIKSKTGRILWSSGEYVGKHDGLAFYTIGQRIGIKINLPVVGQKLKIKAKESFRDNARSVFVVDKNINRNELIVGYDNDPCLFKKEITVKKMNWIAGLLPKFPLKCEVRLRHRQPLQSCRVKSRKLKGNEIKIIFNKPQRAVTPGQFAVLYKNRECLGGGIIQ